MNCYPQDDVDTDSELEWMRLVERGAAAVERDQLVVADISWRKALDIAEGFVDRDPRRAASLNNLGVLAHIMGKPQEADGLYRTALEAWDRADQWVETMLLTQRARSSMFHLRMELRHRNVYDRLARREQLEVLADARAITKQNYADLCSHIDRGVALNPSVKTPVFDEPLPGRAEREGWTIDRPPEFTDEGRLMASRVCTCVIESVTTDVGSPQ